ncbi:hypothetical protein E1B28_000551 [Marasmius oreades]|uniref:Hemerythrin-like domain-containing protein n=1 Tax=Marasmius oreades TaxID=181124 RepID=A0A9P7V1J7_9AGAR|nr:uncharacterized protein E1B28_000551 [Marasmius oreades]KAG7098633.1 hypothetical protein E1B28_000551 [Marasmius oreades]
MSAATREERRWNRFSDHMNSLHQWFKDEYNTLYELADGSFTKRGWSLSLYLESARRLNQHLTMHHTIEERHVFPMLAIKMKEFATDSEHLKSHRGIHEGSFRFDFSFPCQELPTFGNSKIWFLPGMDKLQELVKKYKKEPSTYSPEEMRACLDSFRDVLFNHLDQEVDDLKAENLKKHWSLEELEEMNM